MVAHPYGRILIAPSASALSPHLWVSASMTKQSLARANSRCGEGHTRRWKRDGRFFDLLAKHLDVAKVHETVTRAHGSPAAAGGDDGDQGQDERPQGEEAKEGAAGGGAGRRTVTRVYRIRSKNFQTKNQD